MGEDSSNTTKLLCSLANHPNAAGVLFVSLGCENNNLDVIKQELGEYDPNRIKFLNCQEETDEINIGLDLLDELYIYSKKFKRVDISLSKLKVGFKCGGSDAFSGITANPLLGKVSDYLCQNGATTVLTEVPEMFGAEHLLFSRCKDENTFNKCVNMINRYKKYFIDNNQVVYENPSPGNKEGGITTLDEKSLGCVQKGGESLVCDILDYAEKTHNNGLNLLYGPGNDIVSITNLVASGCHLIMFTTGRGTPLGSIVPTIKISTNSNLYNHKKNWIDFDAGVVLDNATNVDKELFELLINVVNGKKTCNELNDNYQIAIFKNGVTM